MPDIFQVHGSEGRASGVKHTSFKTADGRLLKTRSSAALGYGAKWRRLRLWWLRRHPLCEQCQREKRISAATEVDHIIPHKGDKTLFWSLSNLQSLCKPCHSRKTAAENGGFGNPTRGEK